MTSWPEFMWLALLALLIFSPLTASLGSLMLWRRIAIFSDASAHIALAGVAIGIFLNINPSLTALLAVLFTSIYVTLTENKDFAADAVLIALAQGGLALAVVLRSLTPNLSQNFEALLFGDLLNISSADIIELSIMAIIISAVIFGRLSKLIIVSLNLELAVSLNINPKLENLILNTCLAFTVAFGVEYFGALLMSALLIIPAITARQFARSPLAMIIFSGLIFIASSYIGLVISFQIDVATGPIIVLTTVFFLIVSQVIKTLRKKKISNFLLYRLVFQKKDDKNLMD